MLEREGGGGGRRRISEGECGISGEEANNLASTVMKGQCT